MFFVDMFSAYHLATVGFDTVVGCDRMIRR